MKTTYLIFALLWVAISINAQIHGYVFDGGASGKNEPMAGVSVYILGSNIFDQTEADGHFHLKKRNAVDTLVFSFLGYTNDTVIHTKNSLELEVILKPSPTEIGEVVKIGKAKGERLHAQEAIQTTSITAAGLKHAACCNLSESFVNNATVDVTYADAISGAKQIQMLGLSGLYSQVMTENIPGMRGLARNYGLAFIPGSWMESIQISKGTSSVRNGYESLTGEINAELKKPNEADRFFLNAYADADRRYEINADGVIPVNADLSTMLFVHADHRETPMDDNSDGFLDLPNVTQYSVFNRWFYLHDNMEIQVGVKALTEDRIGGQLSFDKTQPRTINNGFGIGVQTKRMEAFTKVGFISHDRVNTSWAFIGSFAGHGQESFYGLNNYDARQNSYMARFIYTTFIGTTDHTINTGLSFIADNYDEKLNNATYLRDEYVPGAYLEYTFKPNDGFTVLGGIRADKHNEYGTFLTPRVHLKYLIVNPLTVRLSAGKGYRSPSPLAENINLLASSRQFIFSERIKMEDAFNYGASLSWQPKIADRTLTASAEFYRTDFNNQLIVDMEQNVNRVYFYNLQGRSYSNSTQFEVSYELIRGLDVLAAYRIIDARTTINGQLRELPLTSRNKGLLTANYATPKGNWHFSYTLQLNGGGRLPDIMDLNGNLVTNRHFPSYSIMNAQVTRKLKSIELYIGGENLGSYMQSEPVLAAASPFSNRFDASQVWAPITGAMYYAGLRYYFKGR